MDCILMYSKLNLKENVRENNRAYMQTKLIYGWNMGS